MLVSPGVHPESEGRSKGTLTMGTEVVDVLTVVWLLAFLAAAAVLTVVWLEAFLAAAAPALMPPTMAARAASRLADGVLEAMELVIEARAWRASSLCDGLGEGRVRVGTIRKPSHRSVAPLKEFIFYTYRNLGPGILNPNVQGRNGHGGEG